MASTHPPLPERFGRALEILDVCTEGLLFAMIAFSPWAFGTTQAWSIHWMNTGGYALGFLLVAKISLGRGMPWRRATGTARFIAAALFGLTLCILGYVLVSAMNAEFTYIAQELRLEPHAYVKWLPHSLNRGASWQVFWNWLALAGVFWAAHDWLRADTAIDGSRRTGRLRRLIFVLAVNAALVALEGILQRNSGTSKLLWFQATRENPTADAQFGPYAYRANAAQFFNLIWPVALGLWWHWHSQRQRRTERHHWLLPCVMLLVAGALVSMSRGGVAAAILQAGACGLVLFSRGKFSARARLSIALVFAATIAAAFYFEGDQLMERVRNSAGDPLGGRTETYRLAARMAKDYPWFGVGPGAYASVFQLYRDSPRDYWPAQLHNDWLEYLITFGRAGCALFLAAGILIAWRWFAPGGLRTHPAFPVFVWIALGGCLLHARFDFPLQIYSIQFVFVLLCAVLFSISRRTPTRP